MLAARLATGLTLVAVLLAVLLLDERLAPWYPLWFLVSVLGLGKAALEVVGLLNRTGARPSGNSVFGGVLALVVTNWAPHVSEALLRSRFPIAGGSAYDPAASALLMSWPLWTFVGIVMFAFIAQSAQFEKPGQTMATIAGTVLAVAYVGLLGSFVIQCRWLGGRYEGLIALLALIATAKGADIGAYTCGRLLGRRKLWPRLSPNKTVEGAIGGMVFGVAGAVIVIAVARYGLGCAALGWPATIGYGLLVGATAQLGDLMESMIKRDCAQKDASTTLPGFGGFLDVLDSLLFAGPVAYGYWLCAHA